MRIIYKKGLSFIILFVVIGLGLSLGFTTPSTEAANILSEQEGSGQIQAVYGSPVDIRISVVKIIGMVLSFLGVIFLVLTILAGFNYMTAAGNEEKVKNATKQLSQAVIGLIIILSSWGISLLVLRIIVGASKGYDSPYPLNF